ncbi:hypothetical protein HN51_019840 [Arachis hypogaea]|uniref:Uncharacterized protein n=1 Tax=Arachis hypogaea TaxID=3818 RepID=A0A445BYC9_ARAHY|nr:uncharacterized protein DS421_8g243480 [Arachis hypogaea]RYR43770.1 hypothetical protein Ahy_A08g040167 [Arachis hypogaea]
MATTTSFLHLMVTDNNNNNHEDQQPMMDNNPVLSEETTRTRSSNEHGGRIIRSGRNKGARVKPKKPPQRGLGVEQLERLRMQECWKKMMMMNDSSSSSSSSPSSSSSSGVVLPTTTSTTADYYHHHHYPNMLATFAGNNGGVTMKYGAAAAPSAPRSHVHAGGFQFIPQQVFHGSAVGHFMGNNRSGFSGGSSSSSSSSCSSFGSVAMAPVFNPLLGTPLVETSRSELTSIPNLHHHSHLHQPLDFCLKKTRFNNEENVNGSNARKENPLIIWNNGPNFVGYEAPNLDDREEVTEIIKNDEAAADEGVEVVAVHRKGNSVCGRVFMEYEFFPGKDGRGTSSKELEFPTIAAAEAEASPITVSPPPTSTPYRKLPPPSSNSNTNNNIDLSLKLSR